MVRIVTQIGLVILANATLIGPDLTFKRILEAMYLYCQVRMKNIMYDSGSRYNQSKLQFLQVYVCNKKDWSNL